MALRVGLCIAGVTIVGGIGWLVSMPSGIEIVFNGLAIFGAAYLAAATAWLGRRLAAGSTRVALVGTLFVLFVFELCLGVVLVEMAGAKSTATLPALNIAVAVAVLYWALAAAYSPASGRVPHRMGYARNHSSRRAARLGIRDRRRAGGRAQVHAVPTPSLLSELRPLVCPHGSTALRIGGWALAGSRRFAGGRRRAATTSASG